MTITRRFTAVALIGAFATASLAACTESDEGDFPSRPITLSIGFDAGSGADTSGRLLVSEAEDALGVSVNVQNDTGTSGAVSYDKIRSEEADGYSIVEGTLTLVTHDLLGTIDFSYSDLTPIMTYQTEASVIYASSSAPFATWEEMVEYVEAQPGNVNMSTSSEGGVTNIIAKAVERAAGLEFNLIEGSGGGGAAVTTAAGGHSELAVGSVSEGRAHVDSGALIPIAVTGDEPVEQWPEVPTFDEIGLSEASVTQVRAIFGPAEMDDDRVQFLQDALMEGAGSDRFLENVRESGAASTILNSEETAEFFAGAEEVIAPVLGDG